MLSGLFVFFNSCFYFSFCLYSPTPGSRQASPTEAVERMGPSQTGLEMMGQHHPHILQQQNPVQNKVPSEDFQSQEAQNMGGMEQPTGVESLQFDYAGNQIQVDSSGTPVGLFDYSSQQQQVCRNKRYICKMCRWAQQCLFLFTCFLLLLLQLFQRSNPLTVQQLTAAQQQQYALAASQQQHLGKPGHSRYSTSQSSAFSVKCPCTALRIVFEMETLFV